MNADADADAQTCLCLGVLVHSVQIIPHVFKHPGFSADTVNISQLQIRGRFGS